METKTWIIMRHGMTNYNIEGRVQGDEDSIIVKKGIEILSKITSYIKMNYKNNFKIITSPLLRSAQSAKYVSKEINNIDVYNDLDISELKRGSIEGKLKTDFTKEEKIFADMFKQNPWDTKVEGGENFYDLQKRVALFLNKIWNENDLIIISHGFTIRMLIYLLYKEEKDINEISAPHDKIFIVYHDSNFKINIHEVKV